ncbi:MAG: aminopeptidase, partial [Gammaproteobacteria bacterium]|nr:aminopeptidase [Gammaproteobacteria bacterium]
MRLKTLCLLLIVMGSFACSQSNAPAPAAHDSRSHDFFSFANTDQFVAEHLQLELTVDFDAEQLYGSATLV